MAIAGGRKRCSPPASLRQPAADAALLAGEAWRAGTSCLPAFGGSYIGLFLSG